MYSTQEIVAILLAAVANMAIGAMWYSKVLFAKPWMKAMGKAGKKMDMSSSNMMKTMGLGFVGMIIQAMVLLMFIAQMNVPSVVGGAVVGFMAWLGFVAVTQFTSYLYEHNSSTLFGIGTAYQLVALMVMGAIIGGVAWM